MKLLIDQNISFRILSKFRAFDGVANHVKDFGLHQANDYEIFMYARNQQFDAIITIDEDFIKLLNTFSNPPKIVWIRTGNCSTEVLANILNEKFEKIKDFIGGSEYSIFEIVK